MENQIGGIHSIPPELLLQILALDVDNPEFFRHHRYPSGSPSFKSYYSQVYKLSRVCKLWKTILDGSPLVWTRISSDLPAQSIIQSFQKSGTSPLEVIYRSVGPDATWLHNQLAPHFNRVRNLTLTGERELPAVFLEGVGASLEILRIYESSGRGVPTDAAVPRLAADLPKLRRLIHRGAPVTLNWTSITNLTHLEVQECQIRMFDVDDWPLPVLRNNPGLISVTLTLLQVGAGASMPQPIPVHLNHLTTLSIHDNQNAVTARVLCAIVAPICSYIHVNFSDFLLRVAAAQPSERGWAESWDKLATSVLRQPYSHISIDASIGPESQVITSLDGRIALEVGLHGLDILRRLPHLVTGLCRGADTVAEVSIVARREKYVQNIEGIWNVLASVPNVTTWDFKLQNPSELVELLKRSPPTFPQLKQIRVELTQCTTENFMDLASVLQYRDAISTVENVEVLQIKFRGPPPDPPAELLAPLQGRLICFPVEEFNLNYEHPFGQGAWAFN